MRWKSHFQKPTSWFVHWALGLNVTSTDCSLPQSAVHFVYICLGCIVSSYVASKSYEHSRYKYYRWPICEITEAMDCADSGEAMSGKISPGTVRYCAGWLP